MTFPKLQQMKSGILSDFDEEGLLKDIKASKLAGEITKLTWNWDNYSEPVKEAHELMNKVRKLFLEISEYRQRMGSKLNAYQKNKMDYAVDDLVKLIPYMENKIKPSESLENIAN